MRLNILTWNVFHGRDFPPDRELLSWRSRVFRVTERNATHAQVNRSLRDEFLATIAGADWDVALLQEFPPRWYHGLTERTGAAGHAVLTARNRFAPLRRLAVWLNHDLTGASEGGSNVILSRPGGAGTIVERRELVLCPGPRPERRTLAFTRLATGLCVASMHASTGRANRPRAEAEIRAAAARTTEWAGSMPLVLGGDLNVRPRDSDIYGELADRFGLVGPTGPDSLDHLLVRNLEVLDAPAPWPAERREVAGPHGLRIRLSDHAPVAGTFRSRPGLSGK